MFLHVSVILSTGGGGMCMARGGGACMAGGLHGRGRGAHGGHVWQGGACMAGELGVRDRGRAWPEMAIAAGGTHPTGMHSYFSNDHFPTL